MLFRSGTGGSGCTATVVADNLPWATVLNAAGTIDTINNVQVTVTLTGTCLDAGTLIYGPNNLTDTITNDVVPPTGTPNCKVQTLRSALGGELESEKLKTKGVISGNIYVCTTSGAEVGVNDLDKP